MAQLPARWKVPVGDEETSAMFEPADGATNATTLVLAHGAGTNMEHVHMDRLAEVFRGQGMNVVRFNFLYKERGRGGPDRMPKLQACYSAIVAEVRERGTPERLYIGGHSMGGRVASMMAAEEFDCNGLILLSYPLHPSGQPEKLRDAHLADIEAPMLCFNGTRDALCTKELMDGVVDTLSGTFMMHWLEAADHSCKVLKRSGRTYEEVLGEIGEVTGDWIGRERRRQTADDGP